MAVTDVAGSSHGFKTLTTANVQTDFSWHPDGSSILGSMNFPQHGGNRLFLCDPQTGKLNLLPTQPLDTKNVSGVWSPDARRIVFSSQRDPQPLPWRPDKTDPRP
jgi:Tol biopolymer transport system component